MSKSELIDLDQFGINYDVHKLERLRSSNNPEMVDDLFIEELIKAYFSKVRELFIDESVSVESKVIRGDSEHSHVNKKELVSGTGSAEIKGQSVEFEFGIFCGQKNDQYTYDTLEVEITDYSK